MSAPDLEILDSSTEDAFDFSDTIVDLVPVCDDEDPSRLVEVWFAALIREP